MHNVFTKTLRDKRWFTVGWFLGLAFLAATMVAFYPSMRQEGTLEQLVATMPDALKGVMGNLADLTRFDTYLASQLFDIRASLIAGVMVIVLALSISVTEEDKGQLRTLLGLSISRTKLLLQKWAAMAVILFVTILALPVTIFALQSTVDASVPFDAMARLLFMTWLALLAIGTITFAAGMATGKRGMAMLAGIVVMAGSFVISTFGASVDWLQDFMWLSLFHYFPASDVVRSGIDAGDAAVLGALTLVPLIVAVLMFRRRDVH